MAPMPHGSGRVLLVVSWMREGLEWKWTCYDRHSCKQHTYVMPCEAMRGKSQAPSPASTAQTLPVCYLTPRPKLQLPSASPVFLDSTCSAQGADVPKSLHGSAFRTPPVSYVLDMSLFCPRVCHGPYSHPLPPFPRMFLYCCC
ncbi:hypothetical protein V8C26DRAFT_143647 [Trichoderma gracile]